MTSAITIRELAERYDTLLFDSYGVLVNESTGLPGARELIEWLESTGKSYYIVTNDASRSIESRVGMFIAQGVPVPRERIINSGGLIARHLSENGFSGKPTIVLGREESVEYTAAGGVEILPLDRMPDAEVFVMADDSGFDWRPVMNLLLGALHHRIENRLPIHLLLPNPDLIYPSGEPTYSFAGAALAAMIESALERLYGPRDDLKFVKLGKPFTPIFEEANRRAGAGSFVMIGDQMETDIAGANNFGIDSAVVTTGINRLHTVEELSALPDSIRPTFLLESISLG